jgi:hypothetical protein
MLPDEIVYIMAGISDFNNLYDCFIKHNLITESFSVCALHSKFREINARVQLILILRTAFKIRIYR